MYIFLVWHVFRSSECFFRRLGFRVEVMNYGPAYFMYAVSFGICTVLVILHIMCTKYTVLYCSHVFLLYMASLEADLTKGVTVYLHIIIPGKLRYFLTQVNNYLKCIFPYGAFPLVKVVLQMTFSG